jgi:hypothetical protein
LKTKNFLARFTFVVWISISLSGCSSNFIAKDIATDDTTDIDSSCLNLTDISGKQQLDGPSNQIYLSGTLQVTVINADTNYVKWTGKSQKGEQPQIQNGDKKLILTSPNGCNDGIQVEVGTTKNSFQNIVALGDIQVDFMNSTVEKNDVKVETTGTSEAKLNDTISTISINSKGESAVNIFNADTANVITSGASKVYIQKINKLTGVLSGVSNVVIPKNTINLTTTTGVSEVLIK